MNPAGWNTLFEREAGTGAKRRCPCPLSLCPPGGYTYYPEDLMNFRSPGLKTNAETNPTLEAAEL